MKFNRFTSYIKCKRGKGPEFFIESLKDFVDKLSKVDKSQKLKSKLVEWDSNDIKSEESFD